ncbi:MAG: TonB-dependent receptor [Candidatus Eisenbacteria bacterium]|nr:TonB-dependent receptor [Candidatus Eisenbacteria bacterium]
MPRIGAGPLAAIGLLFLTAPSVRADAPGARRDTTSVITTLPTVEVCDERPGRIVFRARSSGHLDSVQVSRFLPPNLGESLASVPGVEVAKTGPWSAKPVVRGLSGDRVLILVDGVALNPARGHGAEPALLPVSAVSSVEVTPGGGGAMHGSDALGGVVEVSTRRPLLSAEFEVTSLVSARGSAPGDHAAADGRLTCSGPRFGAEARINGAKLRALVTPEGEVEGSGFEESGGALRAVLAAGGVVTEAEWARQTARDVGLTAFATPAGGDGVYPSTARDLLRALIRRPKTGPVPSTELLLVAQDLDTRFRETRVDSIFVRQRFQAIQRGVTDDRYRSDLREARLQFGEASECVGGTVGLRWEETGGPRVTTTDTYDRTGRQTAHREAGSRAVPDSRTTATYGSVRLNQSVGRFTIELGSRHDRARTRSDSSDVAGEPTRRGGERLSGSAGVRASWDRVEPFASVSSGFRWPNLDELFFDGYIHGGLRVFGNPSLDPERSVGLEAGIRLRDFGPLGHLDLALHRAELDDLITLQYLGQLFLVPRFQYVNVERARIEGIEATAVFRHRALSLELTGAAPRGRDLETGDRLEDIGTRRGRITLRAEWTRGSARIELAARQRITQRVHSKVAALRRAAVSLTDLDFAAALHRLDCRLAVTNLFDADAREALSYVPEGGRTFAISVSHHGRWKF